MGYLHEGHLRLVDEGRRRADAVVMSVFVNPLQFGPGEDLERYPRDLPRDRALAEARGVDALFVPTETMMYPPGSEIRVVPGPTAERWEGAARPGHFAGVLTVVAKLFHLVEPDVACFGRKDIQQATLVRQMVRDLDWPLEIVVVPDRAGARRARPQQPQRVPGRRPAAAGGDPEPGTARRPRGLSQGGAGCGCAAGDARPDPRPRALGRGGVRGGGRAAIACSRWTGWTRTPSWRSRPVSGGRG